MESLKYGMNTHIIPVFAPLDIVANDITTSHIKVSNALRVTYLVSFGVITADTATLTVECSSAASTTSAEAIPFSYRWTGDTDASSYDAVTTCDSDGFLVTASHDNKIMMVDVNMSHVADTASYLALSLVTESSMSACVVGVVALVQTRYGQYDPLSAT
jgi:hypothetical protein